jgi:hypothetical protein
LSSRLIFLSLLGALLLASPSVQAQIDSSPTPATSATDTSAPLSNTPSAPIPTPAVYQFNSDTVWAHLNVKITPTDTGFSVEAQSTSPLSGWILKNPAGNRVLAKGGCKPGASIQFQVASAFEAGDSLTLFVNVDNEQMPAVIHLDTNAQGTDPASNDLPAGVEAFQEDSDRPYNKMVETLYNRAVEDYGKDQPDDALALLKKAQELDPIQPQVQGLLDKVRQSVSYSGAKADLSNASSVDTDVEKDF